MQRIVIDWGSSSFRAYLLDANGRVVCARSGDCGVLHCGGEFQSVLLHYCGDWRRRWPEIPLILCGMIGSRNGWREVPYLPCPASAAALGKKLLPLDEIANAWIVPGLRCISPAGSPDVMRSEETQVLGALEITGLERGLLVLPGTHSKWVQVEDSQIVNFATFFTGELFALLLRHSSIGAVVHDSDSDGESFLQGVAHSENCGGLLHQVFSARAKSLCEDTANTSLHAYLSGLLIGSEFFHAQQMFAHREILLVGDHNLQSGYRRAARYFGMALRAIDPALATVRGVAAICRHATTGERSDKDAATLP